MHLDLATDPHWVAPLLLKDPFGVNVSIDFFLLRMINVALDNCCLFIMFLDGSLKAKVSLPEKFILIFNNHTSLILCVVVE